MWSAGRGIGSAQWQAHDVSDTGAGAPPASHFDEAAARALARLRGPGGDDGTSLLTFVLIGAGLLVVALLVLVFVRHFG